MPVYSAPASPAPAITAQDLQNKVISVLTPQDRAMFLDLMSRFTAALTPDEQAAMQNLGKPVMGALFAGTAAGLALPTPTDLIDEAIEETLDEQEPEEEDVAGAYTVSIPDDYVAPGYNAMDRDMAVEIVAEHVTGRDLEDLRGASLPNGNHVRVDSDAMPPGPSLTRRSAPRAPLPLDGGGFGFSLTLDSAAGSMRTYTIEQVWLDPSRAPDRVQITGIDALLSGLSQREPDGHLVSDGIVEYLVTKEDVVTYLAEKEEPDNTYQGIGQSLSASKWTGLSGMNYMTENPGPLKDPADIIGGVDPDKARKEEQEKIERELEVGRMRGNWRVALNQPGAFIAQNGPPAPNLLTGVPDVLPDLADDTALLMDLANQVQGITQLPTPAPRYTDTYVPTKPVDMSWNLSDLLAECLRTRDFTISHVHPHDSKMTSDMLDMLDLFGAYTPRTPEEVIEAKQMIVPRLERIHSVLAVAVQLGHGAGGITHFSPAQVQAQIQSPARQAAVVAQVAQQGITISTSSTHNVTISSAYSGTVSNYVNTSNYIGIGTSAVTSPPSSPWPFMGEGENPAWDRSFKLLPGHRYLLDDGSSIEVDATGNYTVHDAEAKVTYRATRMREFNRYVNGSDLIGEFIESLGKLGASQNQAAIAPIEMFIRWLIFKAAEHDQEAPPEDVPPLSAAEIPADPVKRAEVVRDTANDPIEAGPLIFERDASGERVRVAV